MAINMKFSKHYTKQTVFREKFGHTNYVRVVKTNSTHSDSSHLLIMGNFNLPSIDWTSWSVPGEDSPAGFLLEVLDDIFLI